MKLFWYNSQCKGLRQVPGTNIPGTALKLASLEQREQEGEEVRKKARSQMVS